MKPRPSAGSELPSGIARKLRAPARRLWRAHQVSRINDETCVLQNLAVEAATGDIVFLGLPIDLTDAGSTRSAVGAPGQRPADASAALVLAGEKVLQVAVKSRLGMNPPHE